MANRKNIKSIRNLAVLFSIIPHLSFAQGDNYVSAQVGASIPNNKVKLYYPDMDRGPVSKQTLKSSATYDALFGRKVSNNLFAEVEYSYTPGHKFKAKETMGGDPLSITGKIISHSLFGNLSYRFKEAKLPFTPYITGGVGASLVKVNKVSAETAGINVQAKNTKRANFAWQAGVGGLIPVKDNLQINISYKYRNFGKIKSGNIDGHRIVNSNMNTSTIFLGLLYKF